MMNRAHKHKIVRQKNHGFTLVELIVIIAIILCLAAVSIPILSHWIERAGEAEDVANVREAYTDVMLAAITDDHASNLYDSTYDKYTESVKLVQTKKDWQTEVTEICGVNKNDSAHWIGVPQKGGTCIVSYSNEDGAVINWGGYSYQVHSCWTHSGGNNGTGLTLKLVSIDNATSNKAWTNTVTAVEQSISGKIGSTVTISKTDDPTLRKYDVGFYAVDPDTMTILYDSEHQYFSRGFTDTITDQTGSGYSGKVAIYFQLINPDYKGTAVPEDVAEKLMQLVSVD